MLTPCPLSLPTPPSSLLLTRLTRSRVRASSLGPQLKEARMVEDRENTNGNKNATKDRLQQQQGALSAGL